MSVARMNDIGQGYCAVCECGMVGTILYGSANVLANGLPVAGMNGIVKGACGHIGILIATTKNIVNGVPIATLGSQFQGIFSGSIVTGSSNVISS